MEYLTGKYNFFCNIPFYYFEGDDIFSSTITENQTQVKEKKQLKMYDSHNHYRYCEVEFPYTNFLNLRLISLTVVFICLLSFISYPKHEYQFLVCAKIL